MKCIVTELNMPRTRAGSALDGCAAEIAPDFAAMPGHLTRLDLSDGVVPMAAADAAAVIMSCPALRWLGAPTVKQSGAHSGSQLSYVAHPCTANITISCDS